MSDDLTGVVLVRRYRIDSRIARGGVGEVWSAFDLEMGRMVALKTIRSAFRSNPEIAARFSREGALLRRIDDPRVCRLLDLRTDADPLFLVFEHVHGETLETLLRGGRALAPRRVVAIVDEIFGGLGGAHAAGVVHRDLKPANIIVSDMTESPSVKLIDFGISKLLSADPSTLTSTTATLGSPSYMAPEQLGGSASVDERCDVYAAATIAFRALTGTLPFEPKDAQRLLALKQSSPAATLADVTRRSWPAPLEAFFARALARTRELRPRNGADARDAWRSASSTLADDGELDAHEAPVAAEMATEDEETPVISRRRP